MAQYLGIDSATGRVKSGAWETNDLSLLASDGSQGDAFAPVDADMEDKHIWTGNGWTKDPDYVEDIYSIKRTNAYPSIQEQLDMQYWDTVNGTTTWKDAIAKVKSDYPKT